MDAGNRVVVRSRSARRAPATRQTPAMRYGTLFLSGALAYAAACGPQPATPGDSDTSTGDPPGSSGEPDSSTSSQDPTTTDPTTGETTTGETTTGETTTAGTTTGGPIACPAGQAKWEKIGGAALVLPADISALSAMAPMADGNVAMAGMVTKDDRTAPGLLKVTGTGEVLGLQVGELGEPQVQIVTGALERADDDRLVLSQVNILGQERVQGFSSFAADTTPLASLALPGLNSGAFALLGDDAALAGRTKGEPLSRATRLTLGDGAQVWQTDLAGSEGDARVQAIATSPEGDVLLAGASSEGDGGFARLHVWRLDAGGAPGWSRAIDLPAFDAVHDIALGSAGQVLVLRFGPWPEGQADLSALDPATGADLWTVTVAAADADGRFAQVDRILVDADALTIPVARSAPASLKLTGVGVQRVSFAGELQEFVALDVPPGEEFALRTARGECGELLIWTGFDNHWLGSFAP
jgi:hypothetical protein